MHIMTEHGWRRLVTICHNEVWELVSWDDIGKEYVPDKLNGKLRLIRTEEIMDDVS